MEKRSLKKIAEGNGDGEEIKAFDSLIQDHLIQTPSANFSKEVLSSLRTRRVTRKNNLHVWGIIFGVSLVFVIWGFYGFPTSDLTVSLPYLKSGSIALAECFKQQAT